MQAGDAIVQFAASGLLLGLSAGLAPGPLMALVISQTIRYGLGHGVRVAVAPLLTDLPIVVGSILVVGAAASAGASLGIVAIAGAAFIAYLAWDTWHAEPPGAAAVDAAPRSWTRGVTVNLLSPHPYLFWFTVGAPTVLAAADRSPLAAIAFLVTFYVGLVGAKVGIAVATARAGRSITGRGYRLTMRVLAVLLATFAVILLWEGVSILTG